MQRVCFVLLVLRLMPFYQTFALFGSALTSRHPLALPERVWKQLPAC